MSNKIAIIGLGLVGNSMGMALRRASVERTSKGEAQAFRVTGFDPSRDREMDALRKYESIDEVAPSLEEAVRDAGLVIIDTPLSAVREVFEAIEPLLKDEAVVTDVLADKAQVLAWARETLGGQGGFVGGHPFSRTANLDSPTPTDEPSPDIFKGAVYCIAALPNSRNEALTEVIAVAELVGARPLFIDAQEHDSLMAAAGHLPALASASLWKVVGQSPAWGDIAQLAQAQLRSSTEILGAEPEVLVHSLVANRKAILGWVDRYMLALQELRDTLESADATRLLDEMSAIHEGYTEWVQKRQITPEMEEEQARAEAKRAIDETRPSRNVLGTYITRRVFGGRERDRD